MGGSWTEMVPCGVLVPHLTASALTRQSITILPNLLEVKSETLKICRQCTVVYTIK